MNFKKAKFIFLCLMSLVLILFFAACAIDTPEDNEIFGVYEENGEAKIAETVPEDDNAVGQLPQVDVPALAPSFEKIPSPQDIGVEINLTEAPEPEASPWRNATEMVAQMRVGWNLGNTLDSHPHGNVAQFALPIEFHETIWNNLFTTRENIETIHDAGFDVLRVPVTWYPRLVRNCDDYTIREDWMNRVVQVIDYGMDAGMFVIINMHHDERLFSLWDDEMEESIRAISRIWEQIAYVFRDYCQMLIFEVLNEPRTVGSTAEWIGGTPEERANLNVLNQVFVDTVRASGGNNTNRMLMLPTYAAAVSNQTINDFVLPTDPANTENKLIVSLHMYAPYHFALTLGSGIRFGWSAQSLSDTQPITWGLDLAYDTFVSNGISVIMGEMGALNRGNLDSRVNWTYFYVREAAARQIVCLWWDNGRLGISRSRADCEHFGLLNRSDNTFTFPEIVDAMMRATE